MTDPNYLLDLIDDVEISKVDVKFPSRNNLNNIQSRLVSFTDWLHSNKEFTQIIYDKALLNDIIIFYDVLANRFFYAYSGFSTRHFIDYKPDISLRNIVLFNHSTHVQTLTFDVHEKNFSYLDNYNGFFTYHAIQALSNAKHSNRKRKPRQKIIKQPTVKKIVEPPVIVEKYKLALFENELNYSKDRTDQKFDNAVVEIDGQNITITFDVSRTIHFSMGDIDSNTEFATNHHVIRLKLNSNRKYPIILLIKK